MAWLIAIFCLIWLYFYMRAVGATFSAWGFGAFILSRKPVRTWLLKRAMRTPYTHIYKQADDKSTYDDTAIVYMERYWLFNPYSRGASGQEESKYPWFPWNIRIHRILREDRDEHLHDHPWNARTFILDGGYVELREEYNGFLIHSQLKTYEISRYAGCTAQLKYGQYHKIKSIFPGGAMTLFITGRYQGTWGFMVNGFKVKWRDYLGLNK